VEIDITVCVGSVQVLNFHGLHQKKIFLYRLPRGCRREVGKEIYAHVHIFSKNHKKKNGKKNNILMMCILISNRRKEKLVWIIFLIIVIDKLLFFFVFF